MFCFFPLPLFICKTTVVIYILNDIGIDGSNLAKQGGLIREASDMTRVTNELAKKGSGDGSGPAKKG